jgi:hypothetical protein
MVVEVIVFDQTKFVKLLINLMQVLDCSLYCPSSQYVPSFGIVAQQLFDAVDCCNIFCYANNVRFLFIWPCQLWCVF